MSRCQQKAVFIVACVLTSTLSASSANPLDTWTIRYTNAYELRAVAFGNGVFVVVGDNNTLLVSSNGVQWLRPIPPVGISQNLSFLNGLFLISGTDEGTLASLNGISWTNTGKTQLPDKVAGEFNTFAGILGASVLSASSNALDWQRVVDGSGPSLSDITFGNGVFVAVGQSTLLSADGYTWLHTRSEAYSRAVAFGNGLFVGISSMFYVTSEDANNWTTQNRLSFDGEASYEFDIVYAGGRFVAVGIGPARLQDGTYFITSNLVSSADARSWNTHTVQIPRGDPNYSPVLRSIAFGNNTFVTVGSRYVCQSAPLVPPVGDAAQLRIDSYAGLTITGTVGRAYQIQYATNLDGSGGFAPLTNLTLPKSPYTWVDLESPSRPRSFYRAVLLP